MILLKCLVDKTVVFNAFLFFLINVLSMTISISSADITSINLNYSASNYKLVQISSDNHSLDPKYIDRPSTGYHEVEGVVSQYGLRVYNLHLNDFFSRPYFIKIVPLGLRERLLLSFQNDEKSMVFEPYYVPYTAGYSPRWTQNKEVLRILKYKKLHSESTLTPFLGPFSSIPTMHWGVASFTLKLDKDEFIHFDTFAEKKVWSLSPLYKAYAEVFKSPNLELFGNKPLFIVKTYDPNNFLNDKGLFLVYP